ncbi:MAG TPA: SMP-30/gluconolactonase/LRE family protein [Sphingomicrobium sp.]|nr:SMP-30/gluconolactonase/LRE family protein [Sphingomicrobium sp.]
MSADSQIRCVADVGAVLGEGPVWAARESALYWLDIKGRKIFRLDQAGDLKEWPTPLRIGTIAPRAGGGFIAATEEGIAEMDLDSGSFGLRLTIEAHLPDNRFNDGKVDREGRFWTGSMDDREAQASGTLYRIGPDWSWAAVDEGYRVTNGPAFSPDGRTMYHNDSARQITYAFDLAEDGGASNRREFLRFGEGDGYPDGMTVDAEGCLWVAFWDGWCVRRFGPDGRLLETVQVPTARPTSCAFGGPELDRLYITSARIGISAEDLAMQPNAGALFMLEPGVQGVAEVPFAG